MWLTDIITDKLSKKPNANSKKYISGGGGGGESSYFPSSIP